jgi:hypothetical protein
VGKTFYIASSRDGLSDVAAIAAHLEARGMVNAFAWPEHFNHRCSLETCGIGNRQDLARRELAAARSCDIFVGVARLGKGSHVELGAALVGLPKEIYLVGVERADSVFYDHHAVSVVSSVGDLFKVLKEGSVARG